MDDNMATDSSERIVLAIQSTESRIMGEIVPLREAIVRLNSRMDALDGSCKMRHEMIDDDLESVQSNIAKFKEKETEELKAQIKMNDTERKKWIFWGVTTAIGLLLGGGGFFAMMAKILSK